MTKLETIAALARKAMQEPVQIVWHRRNLPGSQAQLDLAHTMTPEVVLRLIAIVEAAITMRDVLICPDIGDHYCHYCQSTIDPAKADAFDAARAAFEEGK